MSMMAARGKRGHGGRAHAHPHAGHTSFNRTQFVEAKGSTGTNQGRYGVHGRGRGASRPHAPRGGDDRRGRWHVQDGGAQRARGTRGSYAGAIHSATIRPATQTLLDTHTDASRARKRRSARKKARKSAVTCHARITRGPHRGRRCISHCAPGRPYCKVHAFVAGNDAQVQCRGVNKRGERCIRTVDARRPFCPSHVGPFERRIVHLLRSVAGQRVDSKRPRDAHTADVDCGIAPVSATNLTATTAAVMSATTAIQSAPSVFGEPSRAPPQCKLTSHPTSGRTALNIVDDPKFRSAFVDHARRSERREKELRREELAAHAAYRRLLKALVASSLSSAADPTMVHVRTHDVHADDTAKDQLRSVHDSGAGADVTHAPRGRMDSLAHDSPLSGSSSPVRDAQQQPASHWGCDAKTPDTHAFIAALHTAGETAAPYDPYSLVESHVTGSLLERTMGFTSFLDGNSARIVKFRQKRKALRNARNARGGPAGGTKIGSAAKDVSKGQDPVADRRPASEISASVSEKSTGDGRRRHASTGAHHDTQLAQCGLRNSAAHNELDEGRKRKRTDVAHRGRDKRRRVDVGEGVSRADMHSVETAAFASILRCDDTSNYDCPRGEVVSVMDALACVVGVTPAATTATTTTTTTATATTAADAAASNAGGPTPATGKISFRIGTMHK